jgi:hypothetical protein
VAINWLMVAFADSFAQGVREIVIAISQGIIDALNVTAEFTKLYKNLDNSQTITTRANRKITKHRPMQAIKPEVDGKP